LSVLTANSVPAAYLAACTDQQHKSESLGDHVFRASDETRSGQISSMPPTLFMDDFHKNNLLAKVLHKMTLRRNYITPLTLLCGVYAKGATLYCVTPMGSAPQTMPAWRTHACVDCSCQRESMCGAHPKGVTLLFIFNVCLEVIQVAQLDIAFASQSQVMSSNPHTSRFYF
jgi:hypothetical protein